MNTTRQHLESLHRQEFEQTNKVLGVILWASLFAVLVLIG